MREHDLSNRVLEGEDAIDAACKDRWNKLTAERRKTITATDRLTREN